MPAMAFVEVSQPHPDVALVTLNRPERMNAMAFDVMIASARHLEEVGQDNEVRVVVLTGAGRGFCSGADWRIPDHPPHRRSHVANHRPALDGAARRGHPRRIRRLHQPVIAAVNGPAIGGGFCLALAADIRIAVVERLLPCRRDQQRAHRRRTRDQLSAAAGHRVRRGAAEIMLTGRDVDADRGRADRTSLAAVVRRRQPARVVLRDGQALIGGAGQGSSSPNANFGTASTPRA